MNSSGNNNRPPLGTEILSQMNWVAKRILFILVITIWGCKLSVVEEDPAKNFHNLVIIFVDDLGYGDLSCYGNPTIRTPHLDRMARGGIKFTQFYVAAPVCTPSRAALLTGCYPKSVGLDPKELTLADMLREKGFITACIGKWHLGHHREFLPMNQGFDYYFGIPFSNDMSKSEQEIMGNSKYPYQLPLMEGYDTVELDPDQHLLTKRLTEKALQFMDENRNHSFFYI